MDMLTKLLSLVPVKRKTNLQSIQEQLDQAKIDNRDCIFIAITSPDFKLPLGRCDLIIREEAFSDIDARIDYAQYLMCELASHDYYTALMDGNKTDRAFSVLFVMVD